jgi:Spy/CpxP family protein refolding chaperone
MGIFMKTILLASVLALSAASAAVAPALAETVVIKTHDHMHMRKHCRMKTVTHWRHHKKIVEQVKVCN